MMPRIDINHDLITRMLDAIEHDILPMTEAAVRRGNKIFGAALLKKSDLSTYLAETNNEIESPLHHGEMHLLKRYYELPVKTRMAPTDLIFLSTHEPCSLCLSAITWGGFDNFFYFFSHEDSRDSFAIPHDLKILKAVFGLEPGGYHQQNEFWDSYSVKALVTSLAEELDNETRDSFQTHIQRIETRYADASALYQGDKSNNSIPLN